MLQVPRKCPEDLSQELPKGYHLISHIANESPKTPPKVPQKTPLSDLTQAASSSSAASQRFYDNFHVQNTESPQKKHYATVGKTKETPV